MDEQDDLVVGAQHVAALRHEHAVASHHRANDQAPGRLEVGERGAGRRAGFVNHALDDLQRAVGQVDEVRLVAVGDEVPDVVDRQGVRRHELHLANALPEPARRVVDQRDHLRHAQLLGDQPCDHVAVVVACGRDQHIGSAETFAFHRRRVDRVAVQDLDVGERLGQELGPAPVALDPPQALDLIAQRLDHRDRGRTAAGNGNGVRMLDTRREQLLHIVGRLRPAQDHGQPTRHRLQVRPRDRQFVLRVEVADDSCALGQRHFPERQAGDRAVRLHLDRPQFEAALGQVVDFVGVVAEYDVQDRVGRQTLGRQQQVGAEQPLVGAAVHGQILGGVEPHHAPLRAQVAGDHRRDQVRLLRGRGGDEQVRGIDVRPLEHRLVGSVADDEGGVQLLLDAVPLVRIRVDQGQTPAFTPERLGDVETHVADAHDAVVAARTHNLSSISHVSESLSARMT